MADETLKREANRRTVAAGVTNDSNLDVTMLRMDPSTKRLLVDATISANTAIIDGEAVDGADFGTMILGSDGSNYRVVATDTSGHLQVDVLSGGGGGVQYTEGDTDASITGTALMFEGAADGIVAATGTAANGLDVDVTRVSGTVTVDGSAVTQPISASSLPLPSGASTAANQTTIIGHVDGIESLLTTIETNTDFGAVVGGGVEATALRVTLANDSTGVLTIDDGGSSITIDGTVAATQSGTWNINNVSGTVSLPTGASTAANQTTANSALSAIQTAVEILDNVVSGSEAQVDVVAALPTGTNTIGSVNIKPDTSGGLDVFRSIDVDETEEAVKATAGQLFGWYIYNNASATTYVKFYNATVASVTVGSTTPFLTIPVPAGAGANVEFTNGIEFDTAITIAATTGVADNDTGAPAANDLIANIFYK